MDDYDILLQCSDLKRYVGGQDAYVKVKSGLKLVNLLKNEEFKNLLSKEEFKDINEKLYNCFSN